PSRYTLSLHDALPIFVEGRSLLRASCTLSQPLKFEWYSFFKILREVNRLFVSCPCFSNCFISFSKFFIFMILPHARKECLKVFPDRKSTRLNSSHVSI